VAVNGDVIYLSTIAYVFAIDRPTGNVNWRFHKANVYYTSPIVDASGIIYFASINARTSQGTVHSVIDNGLTYVENWKMDTGVVERLAPPVLGNDGTLYLSSTGNKIYALR
jgi:outer membrane protein assembly factor BamB